MPSPHLRIDRAEVSGHLILAVSGRMEAENAVHFEEKCEECMREGNTKLIADLSGLTYVSSMGLRSFLSVAKALQAKGGSLRLCCLKGLVKQVFEITGLTHALSVFESVDSAVQAG